MGSRKGRNIVIAALLVAVVIMTIGYAALSQSLRISGTSSIGATWDIRFSKAELVSGETTAMTTTAPTIAPGSTTATFNVNFTEPGQKITYQLTVHNGGSLDAILKSINMSPTGMKPSQVTDGIYYDVTGVTANSTRCNAGADNKVKLVIGWKQTGTEMPDTLSETITITLNYEQI